MKIRLSLRIYFIASMVVLSSIMAIGFSLLSVSYFVDGLDKGLNGVMYHLADTADVKDGLPKDIAGFNVASRWQDMPPIIQQRFKTPTEVGMLNKTKDQSSIFTMPTNLYFVVYYPNSHGEPRYISRIMRGQERPKFLANSEPEKRLLWILLTGIAAIAIFTFLLFIIIKKIAKPVESLKKWAKSLNHNNLEQSPPDFTYNELNSLAKIVRNSLLSTHESLEREQRFLSYASHELRTPISVIRSNVELLNRLAEKAPLNEKQQKTLQRIERAGLTMSDLTDTLLWLSRGDEGQNTFEPVDIAEKIMTLSNELKYLLTAKEVEVEISTNTQSSVINTEITACHIVLTNLIRNAYQHTQHGFVTIKQQGSQVTITNVSQCNNQQSNISDSKKINIGYGLGLQLSEKIINRHGWLYTINDQPGRYEVVVDFSH